MSNSVVNAEFERDEEIKYKNCSLTIDAEKNIIENEKYAQATEYCNGFVKGYYLSEKSSFVVSGYVTQEVQYDGEQFGLTFPKAGNVILTVHLIEPSRPTKQTEQRKINRSKANEIQISHVAESSRNAFKEVVVKNISQEKSKEKKVINQTDTEANHEVSIDMKSNDRKSLENSGKDYLDQNYPDMEVANENPEKNNKEKSEEISSSTENTKKKVVEENNNKSQTSVEVINHEKENGVIKLNENSDTNRIVLYIVFSVTAITLLGIVYLLKKVRGKRNDN
ncbi:hypothetical protein [Viridibacillus arvi]|uniref:hypothetical protein n=1 Tax=Viridibacillus arvi TaxID=263475 RepID=UPI0034CD0AAD